MNDTQFLLLLAIPLAVMMILTLLFAVWLIATEDKEEEDNG